MINSNNTNDNAASSDYSPTNDIHLSYYDQVNLNSSRAGTTNSSDLFDDQGFPNNVISESFHNGGDNFSVSSNSHLSGIYAFGRRRREFMVDCYTSISVNFEFHFLNIPIHSFIYSF